MFKNQRVAADVPARLEAEARMRTADPGAGSFVIGAKIAVGDDVPVRLLEALGRRHVGIGLEEVRNLRSPADLAIELGQGRTDSAGERRLQVPNLLTRGRIKSNERKTVFERRPVGMRNGHILIVPSRREAA